MATTYDYQTGKIERDFKFIRYGEKCKRSGLPCYAGATNRCEKCQHYGGLITPWEMREFTCRNLGDDSYVVCKHPEAQDSKDSEHFISIWYEHFRNEAIIYMGDGATMELEECVGYIDREYMHTMNVRERHEWAHTDKSSMHDVVDFMHQTLHWNETRIVYVEKKEKLSRETGAFLTKRACAEYIKRFGYNHHEPHTYAMTAYRNFELERLLNILKTIDLKDEA